LLCFAVFPADEPVPEIEGVFCCDTSQEAYFERFYFACIAAESNDGPARGKLAAGGAIEAAAREILVRPFSHRTWQVAPQVAPASPRSGACAAMFN
jgi:hypothetical protein